MTSRPARRIAAAAAALALLTLGAACSSTGADESSDDSGAAVAGSGAAARAAETAPEEAAAPQAFDGDVAAADRGGRTVEQVAAVEPGEPRALIKQGNVALRSAAVDDALFDVRKIVQARGGEIAEESTEADADGEPERALLTLRVPADSFDEAIEDLKTIEGSDLIDSGQTIDDVTTEVIDVDVRVALQKRSIDRISILLDRARSIRDIVNIERELARREADLGSLQKRQAFLADQTSMGTISVSIERPREKPEPRPTPKSEDDDSGFLAGLEGGWTAFTTVTTGLLTATGAVLPFAAVGLVVGVPLWVLVPRRRPPATASAAPDPQIS